MLCSNTTKNVEFLSLGISSVSWVYRFSNQLFGQFPSASVSVLASLTRGKEITLDKEPPYSPRRNVGFKTAECFFVVKMILFSLLAVLSEVCANFEKRFPYVCHVGTR